MKIPREAMTPELDAAITDFIGDGSWFGAAAAHDSVSPKTPDRARALLRRHAEWESAFGLGLVLSSVSSGLVGLFLLGGESRALLAVPAVIIGGTAAIWLRLRGRMPHGPQPTAEFLLHALPRLFLEPVQRRYAEALVAVYGGQARDPGGEGLALLRRLAHEESRLLALSRTVQIPVLQDVAGEAQELHERLATARDPAACEVLNQSLDLAQRRLSAAERSSGVIERLEAQRLLLDQASHAALEGILGWGDVAIGLDDLRANVASLAHEAEALEAAVEEMRAL